MTTLRIFKYVSLVSAGMLVVSLFLPWVMIDSKNLEISGMNTEGTAFGKPGYFHLFMAIVFIAFTLTPRLWAKRFNLLVTALNLAWAVRNYFLVSACSGGECPTKKAGLYLMLISSAIILAGALFPDIRLKDPGEEKDQVS